MEVAIKTPKAPTAPDPVRTAQAQGDINRQAAIDQQRLNMVDTYGPTGSSVYTQIGTEGGVPRYRQDINLSPEQQAIYDLENQFTQQTGQLGVDQMGRIRDALSQRFEMPGGQIQTTDPSQYQVNVDDYLGNDYGDQRQRVEDALYERNLSRLQPQYEQDQRSMETQLANMGIARGSEAWRREMDDFMRRKGEDYSRARQDAILAGGNEQSRLFGMDAARLDATTGEMGRRYGMDTGRYGQEVDARTRMINEMLTERNQPLNEASALMGAGTGVQMPQFQAAPQSGINPADYQGAVAQNYNARMQQYQNDLARRNATMGAIFGLGGSLGSAALM